MTANGLILVTGAAGFVGRHVCSRLKHERISLVGIDKHVSPLGVDILVCDVTDERLLEQLFQQHPIRTVIHLAAVLQSVARLNPALATAVNIDASAHLLELAAKAKVERFVLASSMSVYGSFGSRHVFTEGDPTGPIDLYGTAKRYVEMYGSILASRGDMQFVSLRIAGIVGAGARSRTSPWRSEIFEKLGTSAPQTIVLPFAPDSVLSMLHVEDVAAVLVLLATAPTLPAEIYNSPAENWPIDTLQKYLESLDSNVRVEIPDSGKQSPALADGSRFARDFGYKLPSLRERLRRAAQRISTPQS